MKGLTVSHSVHAPDEPRADVANLTLDSEVSINVDSRTSRLRYRYRVAPAIVELPSTERGLGRSTHNVV